VTTTTGGKRERGEFLAGNPFPHPYTIGFFYREKMRAIHRIAPDEAMGEILEVGGGQGGLTKLLYPDARVTNLDMDPRFAEAPVNRRDGVRFICGDATKIPFPDASFDAVTMFDVIEHVPDDAKAMSEAWRVLRPGGALLLSTPRETWRFPHYRAMARFTPHEDELFAEWGHVRRGYSLQALEALVGRRCDSWASFISAGTSLAHDLGWSRFPERVRRVLITLVSPLTWGAYSLHRPHDEGAETAACWRKPVAGD
jgi:SAM-dependent methyltransferase